MRRTGRVATAITPLGIVLLTAVFRLIHGSGYLGYDAYWSLVWGADLAHGDSPDLDRLLAPTPHPLAIVLGALASPLGDAATGALELAAFAAFAALVWMTGVAAWRLFGPWAGVLAAAIVATRPDLIAETLYASVDVGFAALVVGALAVAARGRPDDRPALVLVLLGLAGLLRPEAWLLAAAYAIYAALRRPELRRARLAAGALAAPLIWLLFDLAVTGDPLHSLRGTQALAEQLDRPRSLGTAVGAAPDYLRALLDSPALLWVGIAGALIGLWALFERALLPVAVLVLSLAGFLALGVGELPLLIRYLLLPAVMLCLLAAVATLGWAAAPLTGRPRTAWAVGGVVAAVWIAVDATELPGRIDSVREVTVVRRDLQDDLVAVADSSRVHALARRCGTVYVLNHQLIAPLARELGVPEARIVSAQLVRPRAGLLVSPATAGAERGFAFDAREPRRYPFVVPATFRPAGGNGSWNLYESC